MRYAHRPFGPLPTLRFANQSFIKVQETFNNATLPDENVYKTAIEAALGLRIVSK
ncbi:hypothetical protein [Xylella fastidiosa]|uniref:hypothetical protein n=1 Tax=Xylella fastidiosa TaxID=2371 RepID=UPI000ABF645F|nr:hypothetical protein [Xylella fastidiosa]